MKWRLLFILGFLLTGPLGWAASAAEEMFWAVQNGNRSAVKRLLAQDKTLVYGQDAQGMTPFLIAVQNGDLDMAVLLADAFSRLDTDCPLGNAVHIAVLNEDAAMLRVLFQLCDEEDPDLATLMLNMRRHWGAPKSKTNDGNTPLHLAALKCHRPMYQFLVANGASPTVRNNQGKTPAQLLTACPPEPQKPERRKNLLAPRPDQGMRCLPNPLFRRRKRSRRPLLKNCRLLLNRRSRFCCRPRPISRSCFLWNDFKSRLQERLF